jgi:hypothetical protein
MEMSLNATVPKCESGTAILPGTSLTPLAVVSKLHSGGGKQAFASTGKGELLVCLRPKTLNPASEGLSVRLKYPGLQVA